MLYKKLLQIYQSSFFESESQPPSTITSSFGNCCKYIKVPFLKANHNGSVEYHLPGRIVANISKFLFWKRITTRRRCSYRLWKLLQIYQSSFFESESQHINIFVNDKTNCCKYIKVPFLKANHNGLDFGFSNPTIVANISKFLFWKRITTYICYFIVIQILLQIYQSSFFESESQLIFFRLYNHQIVANISKFLFWKRITTRLFFEKKLQKLLQIYQSSFFESESQHFKNITWINRIVANISKFLFWKRITTLFCFGFFFI